jgi:hypothetical protein
VSVEPGERFAGRRDPDLRKSVVELDEDLIDFDA